MWCIKTQVGGLGLALISAFVPTLGFPYWLHVGGLIVGVVLFLWPVVGYGWNELRNASLTANLFYGFCALLAISIWGMSWWIAPPVTARSPSPAPSPNPLQL